MFVCFFLAAFSNYSLCTGADSEGTAKYECSSGFDDDPKTNAAPDYVLSCMTILSEEQEEEVDGLIKEILPETTVFVAVMKPSNVKRYSSLVSCALLFCQFF